LGGTGVLASAERRKEVSPGSRVVQLGFLDNAALQLSVGPPATVIENARWTDASKRHLALAIWALARTPVPPCQATPRLRFGLVFFAHAAGLQDTPRLRFGLVSRGFASAAAGRPIRS
jgi:hypothetical protein